jgi:hypothetical protein
MYLPARIAADLRLQQTPGYDARALTHLVNAADAIMAGWPCAAEAYLRRIAEEAPAAIAAGRVARIFARSLLARIRGDDAGGEHLHLEEQPGGLPAAFDRLVEETPMVRFGHAAANAAILRAITGRRAVHLVDLGIGSGSQWRGFLEQLAAGAGARPQVRMTRIDAAKSLDELHELGESLRRHAGELGIRFDFLPVAQPVQEMDFDLIDRRPGEALAVNAVFAMHRVPTTDRRKGGENSRNLVLRRLREARPDVLTLVEPDSEHNRLPLNLLVRESLAHYLTAFDALATLLAPHPAERQALEQAYFGREILNILSTDGMRRVERHERHGNWRRRLLRHGFTPNSPADASPAASHEISELSVHRSSDALLLAWRNRPLVAATAWSCRA